MKLKKHIRLRIFAVTAVSVCLLLAGCGAKEETGLGVDGFVYVADAMESEAWDSAAGFTAAGDYLYYLSNSCATVSRMPLTDVDKASDLSGEETVLTGSELLSAIPGREMSVSFHSLSIQDFAVDSDGGIYCIAALYRNGSGFSMEPVGGVLYRQLPTGEKAYWMELPEFEAVFANQDLLALDDEGGVYVLSGDTILAVDKNGGIRGTLSVETGSEAGREKIGRLLEGGNGQVYYVAEDYWSGRIETFIINEAGDLQMTSIPLLSGHGGSIALYEGMDGLLESSAESLYRYDRAENSLTEILKWEDSNLIGGDIKELSQISEQIYMVSMIGRDYLEGNVLLLTKTPAENLPQKEMIVLASLFPDSQLRRSVVSFNLASDKYHVTIESYGADFFGGDANEGAYVRLDSSLVSAVPPDILDLSDLDIGKYAEKGLLEDLSSYMKKENIIRRDNYMNNLLEGYTINGRLVCIPRAFWFRAVFGTVPAAKTISDWTMPELMALTDSHSDRELFAGGNVDWEYLITDFCTPYILECFVDLEQGECSFDGRKFQELLEWVKAQSDKSGQQDALFQRYSINDFISYLRAVWETETDEKAAVMHGYPSVDGRGVYTAVVTDALGILSGSKRKEGAWEFLCFFLTQSMPDGAFPTRKDLLDAVYLEAVTPNYILDEDGNRMVDEQGNEYMHLKGNINVNGVLVNYYMLEKEQADEVMSVIENIDFTPRSAAEQGIIDIISEEAQYFIDGSKSADEVCAVIQNKAQLLLQERGVSQ